MLQTKYITIDEFNEYFPDVNLRISLGGEEKSLAFLKRIEDRMAAYLDSNFNRNVEHEYPVFTDYQKQEYKLALLEQGYYIFRNGDISTDSGYEGDKGEVADQDKLHHKSVAPNAIDHLRDCGLWNREVRGTNVGLMSWFIR